MQRIHRIGLRILLVTYISVGRVNSSGMYHLFNAPDKGINAGSGNFAACSLVLITKKIGGLAGNRIPLLSLFTYFYAKNQSGKDAGSRSGSGNRMSGSHLLKVIV